MFIHPLLREACKPDFGLQAPLFLSGQLRLDSTRNASGAAAHIFRELWHCLRISVIDVVQKKCYHDFITILYTDWRYSMRLKLFKPRLYIYQKVLILFLLLLIPIFIVIRITNVLGSNYLKNELSKSVMLNVDFYIKQLDKDMAQIKRQQVQMLQNSDVLNLKNYPYNIELFEFYKSIERVKERLSVKMDSSNFILNAGIYIEPISKTISVRHGVTDMPNDEFDKVEGCFNKTSKAFLNYSEEGLYLTEAYPKKGETNLKDRQIVVYAELSQAKIIEGLSSLNDYDGSGSFLIDLNRNVSMNTANSDMELHAKILDRYSEVKDKGIHMMEIEHNENKFWVVFKKSELLDMVVFSYFYGSGVINVINRFNLLFILLFIITFAMLFVFSLLLNLMVHRPLHKLMHVFKELENGNMEVSIKLKREDEFGYLFNAFNTMVEQLRTSIRENYEQKLALRQSELKQLQSQMNPHFLYNCFFNISRMCKSEDYEDAMILAQKLGSYYRYITRNGEEEVPLSVEYQNAKDYVDIQSIRFANRIKVHMPEIPREYQNIKVPRLIIQPVLENAYEHAFEKSAEGGGIFVSLNGDINRFAVVIEDDGKFLSEEDLEGLRTKLLNPELAIEKTGIVNVCRRLQLKHERGSGLYASRSEHGGLKIEMVIICKKEQ